MPKMGKEGKPRLAKHRSISPRRLANASHLASMDRCWQKKRQFQDDRWRVTTTVANWLVWLADANLFEVCCRVIPAKQKQ